uniref:Uncharacterized protein n=1 Tax=Tetranychus urticae TaxID=32264 RepID=T1K197_TETUR
MTSPHGSNSAFLPQSSLPLPSHQYMDCSKAKMFKCEGDSELDSVATNAVNMNHGSKRKQSLKLSQAKSYRNDDAKKLADQRWRQSINECYDILRVYTDKDIVFRDGTILKGKESKIVFSATGFIK